MAGPILFRKYIFCEIIISGYCLNSAAFGIKFYREIRDLALEKHATNAEIT